MTASRIRILAITAALLANVGAASAQTAGTIPPGAPGSGTLGSGNTAPTTTLGTTGVGTTGPTVPLSPGCANGSNGAPAPVPGTTSTPGASAPIGAGC